MDSTHFNYQSVVLNFGKHIDDFDKMNTECLNLVIRCIYQRMKKYKKIILELETDKLENKINFTRMHLNKNIYKFTKINHINVKKFIESISIEMDRYHNKILELELKNISHNRKYKKNK